MINKKFINTMIGASSILLSSFAIAADSSSDMSKDEWLKKIKDVVPAMICKSYTENEGVNKQLAAANITYEKCVTLIPASFEKCHTRYYSDIPATINNESAQKWGSTIGECIGTDFALTNLSTPASSTTSSSTSTPTSTSTPPPSTPSSSTTTSSTTTTETPSADSMSKDVWLGKLKVAVPDLICKGFLQDDSLSKQLKKLNIDYDKCVTLIPASIEKCQTELYSSIPAQIDKSNASKWGNTLGECIGKDFAIKYLL